MARTVFFSLGGGLGHLNRSLAVIRHLRREAPHTEPLVITNSPFCNLALSAGVPVLRLPGTFEEELLSQPGLTAQLTLSILDALGPIDVLVVDASPNRLNPVFLDFLARGRFIKVLLYRHEDPGLHEDHLEVFNMVFYPCPDTLPGLHLPARMRACGYIVSRQIQDVLTRPQARLRLGLAPDGEEPVVLAFHAGSPAETMAIFRQVQGASELLGIGHSLRLSTPQVLPGVEYFYPHLVSLFPIMDVFEAADLIVCASGYNAFAEVSYLGRRAIFRPVARSGSHQVGRVAGYPTFDESTSDEELAGMMRKVLEEPLIHRPQPGDYHGAEKVAEAIAHAMALV